MDLPRRGQGRPPLDHDVQQLICAWPQRTLAGYQRIQGELQQLGMRVSATTIRTTLRRHGFDDVFGSEGVKVLVTPVEAPNANAYAERWIRTVGSEYLEWLLIVGRGPLEGGPRGLRRAPHRDLLGGLLHEYRRAA
jgi:hypothetical protein